MYWGIKCTYKKWVLAGINSYYTILAFSFIQKFVTRSHIVESYFRKI